MPSSTSTCCCKPVATGLYFRPREQAMARAYCASPSTTARGFVNATLAGDGLAAAAAAALLYAEEYISSCSAISYIERAAFSSELPAAVRAWGLHLLISLLRGGSPGHSSARGRCSLLCACCVLMALAVRHSRPLQSSTRPA